MSIGDFFGRIGDNISSAPPEAWFSLAQALSGTKNVGTGLAQGIAGFGQASQAAKKKASLAEALKGMSGDVGPEKAKLLELMGEDALPFVAKSIFDKEDKQSGPFAGSGFDASVSNILVEGTNNPDIRNTPQYAIAYANATNPRVVVGPDGNQMLYTPPVPKGILPPGSSAPAAAPGAAPPMRSTFNPTAAPPAPRTPLAAPPANVKPDAPGVFFEPDMHPELYAPTDPAPPAASGITPIPGTGKTPTEAQLKAGDFFTRMSGAEATLKDQNIQSDFLDWSNAAARSGGEWTEFAQGGNSQVYDTAQREWLSALLRKDSGAQVTPQDVAVYGPTYIPQFGDKPDRLAYKAAARERARAAMRSGLTPEQILKAERDIAANPGPNLSKAPPKFGAIVEKGGKKYRFLGGDPSDPKKWTEVK